MPLAKPRKKKLPKKETRLIRPTAPVVAAIRRPAILPQLTLLHLRPIARHLKIVPLLPIVHRMIKRVEMIASAFAIKCATAAEAVTTRRAEAAAEAAAKEKVPAARKAAVAKAKVPVVKVITVVNAAVLMAKDTKNMEVAAKNRAAVPKVPIRKAAAAFPKVPAPAPAPAPVPVPVPVPVQALLWNTKKAPMKANRSTSSIIRRN